MVSGTMTVPPRVVLLSLITTSRKWTVMLVSELMIRMLATVTV